jgi:adenine-specific DNA-methyltransferase
MNRRTLEETEDSRQREQARLDLATGTELRNRTGQFATPSALADEIVRYCWDHWKDERRLVRFLEPCVGTGAFFSSLRRLFPAEIIEWTFACERDESHVKVARSLWEGTGLQVKHTDFLREMPPKQKYNLLITNPPYVRHHHLEPKRKEELQALVRERLQLCISGLAGLYCYFLLLADAWLDEGGLSVWLIPAEFMDVNYGAAVKEYLSRRVRLLHVHRFRPTDVQFDDALVSSAIVIFEKSPPNNQQVAFSLGGSLSSPSKKAILRQSELVAAEKWTKYIAGAGAEPIIRRSFPSVVFGDLFTIKRGLATGKNAFFILPKERAKGFGIPDQFLRPILPSPRSITDPIIETDETGYPKRLPPLALLDCRLPEEAVSQQFPAFWDYLLSGKAEGAHSTYLTSRRTPWYSQEDRPAPPYLCSYIGRSGKGRKPFRFFWNKSQATAHNVYLLLYPKGLLQVALNRRPSLHRDVFQALQSLDTDVLTQDGRVYGGGLFKMEPRELASVSAEFLITALGLEAECAALSRQADLFDNCAVADQDEGER